MLQQGAPLVRPPGQLRPREQRAAAQLLLCSASTSRAVKGRYGSLLEFIFYLSLSSSSRALSEGPGMNAGGIATAVGPVGGRNQACCELVAAPPEPTEEGTCMRCLFMPSSQARCARRAAFSSEEESKLQSASPSSSPRTSCICIWSCARRLRPAIGPGLSAVVADMGPGLSATVENMNFSEEGRNSIHFAHFATSPEAPQLCVDSCRLY